ncbi:MAG TPA: copper resistance protein CopC, partial [Euzebya sp.]|nr:copper resistance protein CopC [Euzebya sp.]
MIVDRVGRPHARPEVVRVGAAAGVRAAVLTAVALLVLAAVALLVLATPAGAHASLEGGSVVDGQILDIAPEELFLDFNEAVTAANGGLRVHDRSGDRVDVGGTYQQAEDRDLVRTALEEDLGEGTYVVTYRVTSADGHPINGALVFSVGTESGGAEEVLAQVFTGDADRPYAIAAALVRWAMYLGTLLAAGAIGVLWWLRREVVEEAPTVVPIISRAAWVTVAAAVLGVALQTILVTGGGLAALLDGGGLVATMRSFVGLSAVVRLAGAVAVLVAAQRGKVAGLIGLAGGTLMLASLLLEGHTLTTGPAAAVWPAAAVHVLTGALWLGGLVVLAVVLRARRRADDPVAAGRAVARFSALFTVSAVAVVLAGSALAWVEVRALRAVLSTDYGLVLLAKLATVVPLVALGVYNNRRLVPVLTARRARRTRAGRTAVVGGSDEVADASKQRDAAWAHLRRTVVLEVAILSLVLGLTGVLVALQPAAEAAGITGAYSENVQFDDIGQMTFTVDPNRAGRNEIHLYLLGETGRPLDVADSVTLRLSQPELDIGPLEREAILAGPGHYLLAGPELSVPGRWEIAVDVALNRFDVVSETVDVTVNP